VNEYKSNVVVLIGHSVSGDHVEIVKFPEENKVFYKIEIISRRVRAVSSSRTSSVIIPARTSSVFIPSRLSAFKRVVPELWTAQRVVPELQTVPRVVRQLPEFQKIKLDLMPEDDLEQSKRT
jgi:hypothetical protein